MRRVLIDDILALANLVAGHDDGLARRVAADVLAAAHCADRYRKRLDRAHPAWGNGTLMSAALAWRDAASLPSVARRDQVEALKTAVDAILDWRRAQAKQSDRQANGPGVAS